MPRVELRLGWVGCRALSRDPLAAENGGSRRHSVEFYTPTPAAVEAWNLTHYTYTCRGPEAAHRAVEFYTETLPTPICSCFSPTGLEETEKSEEKKIHDPQTF